MGAADFIRGLEALGYEVRDRDHGLVEFDYEIEVGPLSGTVITIAFAVPPDWPASPPGGPNVKPRLLPLNGDSAIGHPFGAVHAADQLGPDWQYWSRPFHEWAGSDRSANTYMSHIRHLFDTLPDDLQCSPDD